MEEATREALELFVDKARRLAGCQYVRWLQANRGTALQIGGEQGGSVTTQHTHPDEDATQALVLTWRFFIQQNEHSSFRWLAEHALDDPGLSEQWKQGFIKIHRELNAWLDSPSDLSQQYEVESETRGLPAMHEDEPTKRDIMEVFIFGDFAHANPGKKRMFDRWKANPLWFAMAQLEFDYVLMGALKAVWYIARLSERELKRTP